MKEDGDVATVEEADAKKVAPKKIAKKKAKEDGPPPKKKAKVGKSETAVKNTKKATKRKEASSDKKAKAKKTTTTKGGKAGTEKRTVVKAKPTRGRKPKKKKTAAAAAARPRTPSPPPPPSPPPSPPGPPPLEHAQDLLKQIEFALMGIQPDLEATQGILDKYHQPTILAKEAKANNNANGGIGGVGGGGIPIDPIAAAAENGFDPLSTGGHSNTNHQVVLTGDPVLDKLREYQRHYQQRQRLLVPETKGTDRWDKPKVMGQRRRRIHREVDRPEAPHEPPPVGFTVFVGQMTTKIRHDRINEVHHQPTVMQEIAKLWKDEMTEADRRYYNDFATLAKTEYTQQQMEFRASGKYTPSNQFVRLGSGHNTAEQHGCLGISNSGGGPWIRKNEEERNNLEKEIATYETVDFPPRPPDMNEDYQWRDWRSKLNRKLKLKKLLQDYHNPYEQAIVERAIDHAKYDIMDVAGETIHTVDHSALLAHAQHECVVKLGELKRALEVAKEEPPGDDPESQERALRMMIFDEKEAYVDVSTDEEIDTKESFEEEDIAWPTQLPMPRDKKTETPPASEEDVNGDGKQATAGEQTLPTAEASQSATAEAVVSV